MSVSLSVRQKKFKIQKWAVPHSDFFAWLTSATLKNFYLKNEDDLKNVDNLKNEDELKN